MMLAAVFIIAVNGEGKRKGLMAVKGGGAGMGNVLCNGVLRKGCIKQLFLIPVIQNILRQV